MELQNDLIAALATPEAVSAISVVRLSGRGASKTVEKLMGLQEGRLVGARRAVGNFGNVDYLVAISWSVGKSYTGEEMVDLMCHGSPGTASKVLKLLESNGARLAFPGEFTRRAWMNGRLTSLDVLALSAKYNGNNSQTIALSMEEEMAELTSEIEGLIEFSEDHDVAGEDQVKLLLCEILEKSQALAKRVREVEILPRVYIMGPVNAGKSTLFNTLIGDEAAVVSNVPGTTRDGSTRTVSILGRNVEVCDTAGSGGEILDTKALQIAMNSLRQSDRILWMDPFCAQPPVEMEKTHKLLKIRSRADESEIDLQNGWISHSSLTNSALNLIRVFVTEPEEESPSWRLDRMVALLKKANLVAECNDFALLAEIVNEILHEAERPERSGDAVERALDRFCVGK